MQFRTRAIHVGQERDAATGAVVPPVHVASTFVQPGAGQWSEFDYSRSGNPTRKAFETTLASLAYARRIPAWRERGYVVGLIYLRLPDVAAALARVRRRVAQGGHGLPEATIRRRFARSAGYFERHYKGLVDEWYVWDSLEDEFRLAEAWND